MENEIEMLIVLVCFLMFTLEKWKNNVWIHNVLTIGILWFGIITIRETSQIEYCLILMIFSIIMNFLSNQLYRGKNKNV